MVERLCRKLKNGQLCVQSLRRLITEYEREFDILSHCHCFVITQYMNGPLGSPGSFVVCYLNYITYLYMLDEEKENNDPVPVFVI